MDNQIYISVSINHYGTIIDSRLVQGIGNEPLTIEHISYDKARKLMWEIVLAGGTREVEVNQFNRKVQVATAHIFLPG